MTIGALSLSSLSTTTSAFVIPSKTFTSYIGCNASNVSRKLHFSAFGSGAVVSSLCELRSTPTDSSSSSSSEEDLAEVMIDDAKEQKSSSSPPQSSPSSSSSSSFKNDGLFSWMQPYLDAFGFVEGNTVYYGPGIAVDPTKFPSTKEQERLRNQAKENMINIGMEERERRREGGNIATKVAIVYAIVSSIFLDDGSLGGHFVRLGLALVRTWKT